MPQKLIHRQPNTYLPAQTNLPNRQPIRTKQRPLLIRIWTGLLVKPQIIQNRNTKLNQQQQSRVILLGRIRVPRAVNQQTTE